MEFPEIWELAKGPNPELMAEFMEWLTADDERFQSAITSMQWIPVGINILTVATKTTDGTVTDSLQLNFYNPDIKGNDGAHAHAKDARTIWYAQPGTRQVITREQPLPINAPKLDDVLVEERVAVGNCLVDYGDGQRPGYRPVVLGRRLIMQQSVSSVAPLGWQDFKSTEVHSIGFEGKGVAISAHYKGAVEAEQLNGPDGLVYYKGLTPDEAAEIEEARNSIGESLTNGSLGPVTMLFPNPDFNPEDMESEPTCTETRLAEELVLGGLNTVRILAA